MKRWGCGGGKGANANFLPAATHGHVPIIIQQVVPKLSFLVQIKFSFCSVKVLVFSSGT